MPRGLPKPWSGPARHKGRSEFHFVDIQHSQEREESVCISEQSGPAGFDRPFFGSW
jgi:hypothetical protein